MTFEVPNEAGNTKKYLPKRDPFIWGILKISGFKLYCPGLCLVLVTILHQKGTTQKHFWMPHQIYFTSLHSSSADLIPHIEMGKHGNQTLILSFNKFWWSKLSSKASLKQEESLKFYETENLNLFFQCFCCYLVMYLPFVFHMSQLEAFLLWSPCNMKFVDDASQFFIAWIKWLDFVG